MNQIPLHRAAPPPSPSPSPETNSPVMEEALFGFSWLTLVLLVLMLFSLYKIVLGLVAYGRYRFEEWRASLVRRDNDEDDRPKKKKKRKEY